MRPAERFGTPTLIGIVVANMIGAGVFTTSGFSMESLGSPARVLTAWLVASVIALCGAASYGDLARRLPVSGGEYLYLSRRLSPFFGFLSGWVSLTAGFSGAIAASALTFGEYIVGSSAFTSELSPVAIALPAVLICGVGHSFVGHLATRTQNGVVVLKLLALAAFLAVAAGASGDHRWHWDTAESPVPVGADLAGAFATSLMWISFSFAGFNGAVYVASEVREARRAVPRALLAGTVLVAAFYLLLNLVFVTATPASEIAGRADVAAVAARAVGGEPLSRLIRAAIVVATLSSVAVMIQTGPRVYARMADDGVFFRFFSTAGGSLHRAILLQTGLAALLVCVGSIRELLSYLGTTLSLSSALAVATLLMPRNWVRSPGSDIASGGRPPFFVLGAATVYVACTLIFVGLMTLNEPAELVGTAVTIVAGTGLWRLTRRQPPVGEVGAAAAAEHAAS